MYQLITDLTDLFADSEYIQSILDDYSGEYEDMLVKEQYELYPEIRYPNVTIEEIENVNARQFKDDSGEFASNLGYQLDISCSQTENYTAQQNVRRVAQVINDYLQKDKYKCLDRVGGLVISPLETDPNIKTGHLRYTCAVRHDNNTIYRRY